MGRLPNAIPEFTDRNRNVYPDWRLYYDRPTAERVARIFAEDFAAFGYDLDSWRLGREVPELRTSATEAYWRREVMERNELIEFLYELLRTNPYDRGPVRAEAEKARIRPNKALEPD